MFPGYFRDCGIADHARPNCGTRSPNGSRREEKGTDTACPCHTEYEMRGISIFATLHAISRQRYHDNTPAVALQQDVMQSAEDSPLPSPLLGTCGTKRRDGRRESYTRPASYGDNDATKKQFLHRAETPQSKRIVALGTHSLFALVSLSQARTMEQKPVLLSRLGDSV